MRLRGSLVETVVVVGAWGGGSCATENCSVGLGQDEALLKGGMKCLVYRLPLMRFGNPTPYPGSKFLSLIT